MYLDFTWRSVSRLFALLRETLSHAGIADHWSANVYLRRRESEDVVVRRDKIYYQAEKYTYLFCLFKSRELHASTRVRSSLYFRLAFWDVARPTVTFTVALHYGRIIVDVLILDLSSCAQN